MKTLRLCAVAAVRKPLPNTNKLYVSKSDHTYTLCFNPKDPKGARIFATVDLKRVWDKGTRFETVMPTLAFINVPTRLQRSGLGKKLVKGILAWMAKKNVEWLIFEDFSSGFWSGVKDAEFKDNLYFPPKRKGGIGYLFNNKPSNFPL